MSAKKKSESSTASLAILGGGNLGQALARGLVRSGTLQPDQIHVTSLHPPPWRDWPRRDSRSGAIMSRPLRRRVPFCWPFSRSKSRIYSTRSETISILAATR